jgi:hypothetical protein
MRRILHEVSMSARGVGWDIDLRPRMLRNKLTRVLSKPLAINISDATVIFNVYPTECMEEGARQSDLTISNVDLGVIFAFCLPTRPCPSSKYCP